MRFFLLLLTLLPCLVHGAADAQDRAPPETARSTKIGRTVDAPRITTLDAIRADFAGYNNQWVRLTGQIDRCSGSGCRVCPEEATPAHPMPKRCLSIDWDRQSGAPPAFGFIFDPVYRYATVDLVARFDQSCLVDICTDRAPVLLDARVVNVLKRRPSALGLGGGSERDRLLDAPAEVAAELTALLAHGVERGPAGPDYRAYAYVSDPSATTSAMICRSYGKDDLAKWPADAAAGLAPSTEDRFRCYWADRRTGRWFIHPTRRQ